MMNESVSNGTANREASMDILFKTDDWVFSYRVAGICVHKGAVLLQTTTGPDRSFAFPGGHVEFGETNEETLIREFREEIGAEIAVKDLKWVAEIFFPWGNKPCHQICLYYLVEIVDGTTPRDGIFSGKEQLEGRNFALEFHWVPIEKMKDLEVYPVQVAQLLEKLDEGVQHFVYRE
jgi:8-oxo-dGTP pyrophosphatase MutT (NUDIX family)